MCGFQVRSPAASSPSRAGNAAVPTHRGGQADTGIFRRHPCTDSLSCATVLDVNNIVNRGGAAVEWEILMTAQVEEFLDALHEADRDTHRLVN
ncbi:hypothetical protein GCM10010532_076210 [Dactylosporangium siamense]|uniref:Uncharacterized protein n=1 Tax=Dactylosporangium siamense TaxID=685454 RepID=A0A919PQB8_9ACTN|nr:hypothetical protein Dsi01nite_058180 [Dactylosporangium siamense]